MNQSQDRVQILYNKLTAGTVKSICTAQQTLKLPNKYPTGKGANWVEIVSFD